LETEIAKGGEDGRLEKQKGKTVAALEKEVPV